MKRYLVQFWYNTDLRAEEPVEASGDVAALVTAIERNPQDYDNWVCNGKPFRVEIKLYIR